MTSAIGLGKGHYLNYPHSVEFRIVPDSARETKTTFPMPAAIAPGAVRMNLLTPASPETLETGRERDLSLHQLQLRPLPEKEEKVEKAEKEGIPERTTVHNFERVPLPGERAVPRMALDHQGVNIRNEQSKRELQLHPNLITNGDQG